MSISILTIIGPITNPLPKYGGLEQATLFLSYVIRLLTIGAGLFAFINFVIAGIGFIGSAGNPEAIQKAWAKIYRSILGLSVVVLSFAFAGLLGLILFGDAGAILKPTIYGP